MVNKNVWLTIIYQSLPFWHMFIIFFVKIWLLRVKQINSPVILMLNEVLEGLHCQLQKRRNLCHMSCNVWFKKAFDADHVCYITDNNMFYFELKMNIIKL